MLVDRGTNELRTVWKLAGFGGLTLAVIVLASLVGGGAIAADLPETVVDVLFQIVLMGGLWGVSGLCASRFDHQSIRAVGIGFDRPWGKRLAQGALAGTGLFTLCWAAFLCGGYATVRLNPDLVAQVWALLLAGLICFLYAASEELICRGYAFQVIARQNLGLAVVLSGLFFIVMHFWNPGGRTPLVVLNLGLGHLMFAACYLRTRSLWLPIGLHAAWNYAQWFVFGIQDGEMGISASLLHTDLNRNLWTGNEFGPEGGLVVTLIVALATILIWRWVEQQTPEHDLMARD